MLPIRALQMRTPSSGGGATAHGPISFVGSGVFSTTNGAAPTFNFSSLLDTLGGTPTTANLDVAIAVWASHCNGANRTIAAPTGWTKSHDIYVNAGLDTNLGLFYKILDGTETSATFDSSGSSNSAIAGSIMVFRGVDTGTPFDVADVEATGSGTGHPDPAAITPSTAGSWIVVAVGGGRVSQTVGFSAPADLSAVTNEFASTFGNGSNDAIAGIGIKTDWTSGAFDPGAWSGDASSSSNSWASVTMALRSAP